METMHEHPEDRQTSRPCKNCGKEIELRGEGGLPTPLWHHSLTGWTACSRFAGGERAEPVDSMVATVHARTTRFEPDAEGGWGLTATAELRFALADGSTIVQTISSPGLWGLEEQEDAAYLSEVEVEQNELLDGMLAALGLAADARRDAK